MRIEESIIELEDEIENLKNQLDSNDELQARIDKLNDEIAKDKMEQFDNYVIYLLEKYEKIIKGEGND